MIIDMPSRKAINNSWGLGETIKWSKRYNSKHKLSTDYGMIVILFDFLGSNAGTEKY